MWPVLQALDRSLGWCQQGSSQAERSRWWRRRQREGLLRSESRPRRRSVKPLWEGWGEGGWGVYRNRQNYALTTCVEATRHQGAGGEGGVLSEPDTLMICTFCVQLNGHFSARQPAPRHWTIVLFINLSGSCYGPCQWSPV